MLDSGQHHGAWLTRPTCTHKHLLGRLTTHILLVRGMDKL